MRWLSFFAGAAALILAVSGQKQTFPACTTPRVRKEWRSLTKAEKANWISAVKCLGKLPSRTDMQWRSPAKHNKTGGLYNDFGYLHIDVASDIHQTPWFYPFHRWYLNVFESNLITKCGLTTPTPYWDWTKETGTFETSPMFTDLDPESGLGGWGDPNNDYQITNGAFKDFEVSYPVFHRLRRQYTLGGRPGGGAGGGFPGGGAGGPPGGGAGGAMPALVAPEIVRGFVAGNVGNFAGFQSAMEAPNGPHNWGHGIVGGDMSGSCPKNAGSQCVGPFHTPNEPLFWMHHGMIDRTWWQWQKANTANYAAYNSTSRGSTNFTIDAPMANGNLGPVMTVRDMLNTTSGFLCYTYE